VYAQTEPSKIGFQILYTIELSKIPQGGVLLGI